ncbi:MAG: hypothetical protein MJ006_00550 [Methanocorpusculum sp.]|nr:hypothetical protein [Methanocorpusculum sp.]
MMHYLLVSDLVSEAEFEDLMEKKSREYAGILDEVTIAMMVVDDLGRSHIKIGDIPKAATAIVSFYGKVLSIEGPKEIPMQEGDEEPGAVGKLVLGDATGTTAMTLWDEKARALLELHEGDVVEVIAKPRFGKRDVGFVAMRESSVEIVETKKPPKSETLEEPLEVKVLSVYPVKTIAKRDGSEAAFQTFIVGDASGTARLVSWSPETFADVDEGASISIRGVVRKEDEGVIEYQASDNAEVSFCGKDIDVLTIDAEDADVADRAVICGTVVSSSPVRQFVNRRNKESKVKNIRIRGKNGREVAAALWAEMSDIVVIEGDRVEIANAEVRPGKFTELELSVGFGAAVKIVSPEEEEICTDGTIHLREVGLTLENSSGVWLASSDGALPEPGCSVLVKGRTANGRIMIEEWKSASIDTSSLAAEIQETIKKIENKI